MVTFGLVVVGAISFLRLPQELFPHVTFPQVTVVTDYVNAAPEEIETLITRPIEEAVGSVSGLKRIESVSREGRSTITVSFNWGQDIDFAALAVREKIDLVKERLPKESEDPVVLKFDPLARPIMIISVTGREDVEPAQLKLLTEKMLKDNLEKIEGVASATISGGVSREILVEIDQGRLQANHLSLLEVIKSVEEANVSYPAGSIKKGLYEYLIRTVGEFRSVREIQFAVAGVDTVQKLKREDTSFVERGAGEGPRETLDSLRTEVARRILEKRLVVVKDIAEVVDGFAEKTSVSRYNAKENISISVQKQAATNTIRLVDRLRETLALLKEDLDARGLHFEIIYDHSVFIRQALRNLFEEATSGGVLAFLVLLVFLRSLVASILVTVTLPVTVMGVFFLMGVSHISINIMSLGGLALAIGMIVDTSIVVLENIFRRQQLGDPPREAAISGAKELMSAVISSNLTTIAVFFPMIVFVPGIVGQIIKDLSWTVIYTQAVAILLPVTLVPMLAARRTFQVKKYEPYEWTGYFKKRLAGGIPRGKQNLFLIRMILATLAVIAVVVGLIFPMLEREVLPRVDQGQFLIKVDMQVGTRLDVTDRVCKRIEEMVSRFPGVKDIAVTIGSERSQLGEVKVETLRSFQGIILITLDRKRGYSSAEFVHAIREKMKGLELEGAAIDFVMQESEFQVVEGGVKPILIEVRGYDWVSMGALVEKIKEGLKKIDGVLDLQDDRGAPSPETKLEIDKRRAALYGISALDISLIAKAAIEGVIATQYREAGHEYDVRIRLSRQDRENIDNLNNLLLYSQVLDALIPLKEVALIVKGMGPSEIRRSNQERTITVSAGIAKNVKSKDVLKKVQRQLRELHVPEDFQVVLSGKVREVKESFTLVTLAFFLAVLLVYMIMASQFESFVQPLIIMVTVPLAFVGVALVLWLTGNTLNVITLLGLVVLGGVVVNNGIVLIEYTNQLRSEGVDAAEAAFEAAKVRTRPILMTALTTIVGLLPLALGFGEGAELRRPLAITVMGGLFSSTFLTLVIVPSLYILAVRGVEMLFGNLEGEAEA